MKTLLRNYTTYTLSLYFLSMILPSVTIKGGLQTFILAGIALTILYVIVRPILNIIGFPINLVTLGLYTTFVNVLLLYLVTVVIPNITIASFAFKGATFFGFIVPAITLNTFFTLIFASFVFTLLVGIAKFLMEK